MTDIIDPQFLQVQELIHRIKINLKTTLWLMPENLEAERQKFFIDHKYNPQFIYPAFPEQELKGLLAELEQTEFSNPNHRLERIINRKLAELKIKIKLILARNLAGQTNDFSDLSAILYGLTFPPTMIKQAQEDADLDLQFEFHEPLEPEQIKKRIISYLQDNEINDWQVIVVTDGGFYFRVKPARREIWVSTRQNFETSDLDGVFAHEIDCHVIRSINMHKQTDPLLQKQLPFYLQTDEGLACFLQDYLSSSAQLSRRHHALKYLAGVVAKVGSFSKTAEFLLDRGFSKELTFQRTFRLKRGFADTSLPGLNAREGMYYEGMQRIKTYLQMTDQEGIRRLFAGKFSLEDLSDIDVPKDIILPKRITELTTVL